MKEMILGATILLVGLTTGIVLGVGLATSVEPTPKKAG